jgi:gag-polyprotein putative aspartyl protease
MKKVLYILIFCCPIVAKAQIGDTIKFKNLLNLITIPVKINGVERHFIFDTGAEKSVISEAICDNLEIVGKQKVSDSNNKTSTLSIALVKKLTIGNAEVLDKKCVTFKNPLFTCMGFDGLIGIDIIQKYDWIIDFKNNLLIRYELNNNLFDAKNLIFADYYNKRQRPRIKLTFKNNETVDFLFDSGSSKTDLISGKIKKIESLATKSTDKLSESMGLNSLSRMDSTSEIEIPIALKNNEFKNKTFQIALRGEEKIGNDFWTDNTIYYSFEKKKLAITTNLNEYEKPSFGLRFKMKDDKIVIGSITFKDDIKAFRITSGDVIKSINNLTFKDNCELLKYQHNFTGDSMVLELENGKKITLKK